MTPETGLLVPPGDPSALAQALIGLLEDEPRRRSFGVAARRIAEERYSWDRIARRLGSIYELSPGAPRPPSPHDERALREPRAWRAALVLPFMGLAGAMLWWRGPDWNQVGDAFSAVRWEWVVAAVGFNLLSVVARASRGGR